MYASHNKLKVVNIWFTVKAFFFCLECSKVFGAFANVTCRLSLAQVAMGGTCMLFGFVLVLIDASTVRFIVGYVGYGMWIGGYVSWLLYTIYAYHM